ncbi:MAG: ROK family protein, partial [Oscillospiraceae bacterium]|nr:ROK family protein [Oscillospiraceae bacterium]
MNRFGITVDLKHTPPLDPAFIPIMRFNQAFLATAKKPVGIAVERADGQMASFRTFIHGTPDMEEADRYYIERLVKTVLWVKGGFKVYVSGDEGIYQYLKAAYGPGGAQAFDCGFMANVFERPFEVVLTDHLPEAKDAPKSMGG